MTAFSGASGSVASSSVSEADCLPDDPDAYELRTTDVEHPDDVDPDPVDSCGQPVDTTWTRDLHDPYLWAEPAR